MASFNLWIEVKKRQHLGRENTDDDAVFSSNACVRKASTSSDQSSETHPQLLGGLPAAQRTSETPALEEQPLVRFLLQEHENPRTGEEKHVKGPRIARLPPERLTTLAKRQPRKDASLELSEGAGTLLAL